MSWRAAHSAAALPGAATLRGLAARASGNVSVNVTCGTISNIEKLRQKLYLFINL